MKQQSVKVPPPIFVTGAPRSGTTLIAKILGRHSRIFMPGETHFFDDIYIRRRELGELSDVASRQRVLARLRTLYRRYDENSDQQRIDKLLQTDGVLEKLTSCASYKTMFSYFMEIQVRPVGKVRWGNNVPKDIFHVEDILSFYPAAKFIVCVRDVRDFLLSYKNKWRHTGDENADRVRRLYHPIVTTLLWKASVKQIIRMKDLVPRENLMVIRYENFVQNPVKVVGEICRFVGEKFEADMLNVDEENSSFDVPQKGIYSSSVGRWRRLLTSEEAYVAQKLARRGLLELGYGTTELKVNPLTVSCMYVTVPFGLWRALRANRALRGPLLPYVGRRFAALR